MSRMDRLRKLVRQAPGLDDEEITDIYMTRNPSDDGSYSTIKRQVDLAKKELGGAGDMQGLRERISDLESVVETLEETIRGQIKANLNLKSNETTLDTGWDGIKKGRLSIQLKWDGENLGHPVGGTYLKRG